MYSSSSSAAAAAMAAAAAATATTAVAVAPAILSNDGYLERFSSLNLSPDGRTLKIRSPSDSMVGSTLLKMVDEIYAFLKSGTVDFTRITDFEFYVATEQRTSPRLATALVKLVDYVAQVLDVCTNLETFSYGNYFYPPSLAKNHKPGMLRTVCSRLPASLVEFRIDKVSMMASEIATAIRLNLANSNIEGFVLCSDQMTQEVIDAIGYWQRKPNCRLEMLDIQDTRTTRANQDLSGLSYRKIDFSKLREVAFTNLRLDIEEASDLLQCLMLVGKARNSKLERVAIENLLHGVRFRSWLHARTIGWTKSIPELVHFDPRLFPRWFGPYLTLLRSVLRRLPVKHLLITDECFRFIFMTILDPICQNRALERVKIHSDGTDWAFLAPYILQRLQSRNSRLRVLLFGDDKGAVPLDLKQMIRYQLSMNQGVPPPPTMNPVPIIAGEDQEVSDAILSSIERPPSAAMTLLSLSRPTSPIVGAVSRVSSRAPSVDNFELELDAIIAQHELHLEQEFDALQTQMGGLAGVQNYAELFAAEFALQDEEEEEEK